MALFSGVNQQRRPTAPLGGRVPIDATGPQRPAFDPNKQRPQLPGLSTPAGAGGPLPGGQGNLGTAGPGGGLPPGMFGTLGGPSGGPPPPNSLGIDTAPVNTPLRPPGPTQQFGPGNSLIGTQFNPGASERLQGVQGQVDTARGQVAAQAPFQDMISEDLGALRTGPSRAELASQAFNQIQEGSAPRFQGELRDVGRKAAALGRIGSGVTTSELGDVQLRRERDLDLLRRGLSTDAAGRELEDRFQQLGATQGVSGQLFGQAQSRLGQLAGIEGQQFGQEASQRGELRGERGFQTALDQQGIQNRVQQRQLEEALLSGQFGRNFNTQQLLANVGFNPASPANFGNQAGQFSQSFGNQANASNDAAAAAIQAWMANQGGGQQQQPFAPPPGRLPDFQPRQIPAFNPRP